MEHWIWWWRERNRSAVNVSEVRGLLQTFVMVKSTFCPVIRIDYQHWFAHLSIGLINRRMRSGVGGQPYPAVFIKWADFIVSIHHLVSIHGYSVLWTPISAHASGAVTLVDHAHPWLMLVSNGDMLSCHKCSVLVGVCISETQCWRMGAGHACWGQILCSVTHAPLKHSFVWHSVGLRQGRVLLCSYFGSDQEEMERPQSLHPDFPLKPQSASIPYSTFQLSSLKWNDLW